MLNCMACNAVFTKYLIKYAIFSHFFSQNHQTLKSMERNTILQTNLSYLQRQIYFPLGLLPQRILNSQKLECTFSVITMNGIYFVINSISKNIII